MTIASGTALTAMAHLGRVWFVVGLLFVSACGNSKSPIAPTPPPAAAGAISAQASAYLDQLIGYMQRSSIKRLTIDWAGFRTRVFESAGAARTIADLFPAIRFALQLLGDGHSSYQAAGGAATSISVPTRSCIPSGGITPALPASIGYVRVGAFNGSGQAALNFATQIQSTIAAADRDDLTGWMVDLRSNGGGNMWPMIAGLGPIIGEDLLGYFIDPVGQEVRWEYRDGRSISGGNTVVGVVAPYRLRRERPRVAVLSDNAIASSGEATLIAFRQRPDARSFGVATCGLSTANTSFPMSDGATLILTVSTMADRTKRAYGDTIAPDEVIADTSQAVQRAIAWLQTGS